jgi:hypothetical protein
MATQPMFAYCYIGSLMCINAALISGAFKDKNNKYYYPRAFSAIFSPNGKPDKDFSTFSLDAR